jgi:hypothetical protein
LTNGQIVDLAYVAHQAMREGNIARIGGKITAKLAAAQLPTVITVVVSGNNAYISSSLKGGPILYNKADRIIPADHPDKKPYWRNPNGLCPAAITDGLRQCDKPLTDGTVVGHQNGGACGEVMVGWTMCEILGDAQAHTARVVAVEYATVTPRDYSANAPRHMVIKDPCGDDTPDVSHVIPMSSPNLQLADHKYRTGMPKVAKPSTSALAGR